MGEVVLDASAIMAVIRGEDGAERVEDVLADGALVTAANLAEVITKLIAYDTAVEEIRAKIAKLNIEVVPVTEEDGVAAGFLYFDTKEFGLSLGDRCCIAVGMRYDALILTADRPWKNANLDPVANIELIR
jgi:PIN domain nuclease of toxin-antitoxin system